MCDLMTLIRVFYKWKDLLVELFTLNDCHLFVAPLCVMECYMYVYMVSWYTKYIMYDSATFTNTTKKIEFKR